MANNSKNQVIAKNKANDPVTSDYLCKVTSYRKNIPISNDNIINEIELEKLLIQEIKLACKKQGYKLIEISIEKHESPRI